MRTTADSPTLDCTVDGCDRPLRARGMCSMHYKRWFRADGRNTVTVPCDGCGDPVTKDKDGRGKYETARCSELCRHWIHWGAWSIDLPRDHPARPQKVKRPKTTRLTYREFDCDWCGESASTMYASTRFCTTACKLKAKAARRRAREYNAPGTYRWSDIVRLWRAFDKRCAYCYQPTPLTAIQAEHVHPLSRGGRNDLGNLLPSCGLCNGDKRDLLLPEWAADRARRHLTPVHTTWADDDPRYRHLTRPAAA